MRSTVRCTLKSRPKESPLFACGLAGRFAMNIVSERHGRVWQRNEEESDRINRTEAWYGWAGFFGNSRPSHLGRLRCRR